MATREQGAALRTKREPLCPPTRLIPGWDSALAGALVCLTTTVACEPATGPSRTPAGAVASVEITPPSASVPAGQTLQLMAVPKDVNGTLLSTQTISWSSNNEAAASSSNKFLNMSFSSAKLPHNYVRALLSTPVSMTVYHE